MRSESGNVTILSMLVMATLTLALIFALEFSCVYAQRTTFDNCLNIARESTFTTGFSMELKNSSDPWGLLSAKLVKSLRDNNYQGNITIWFYEATAEEIERANPSIGSAKNVRAMAYQVQLDTEYKSVIASAQLLAGLNIKNETTAVICPYSLYETYKPEGVEGTLWRYQASAKSNRCEKHRCDKSEMTSGMQQAVDEALSRPAELSEDD